MAGANSASLILFRRAFLAGEKQFLWSNRDRISCMKIIPSLTEKF